MDSAHSSIGEIMERARVITSSFNNAMHNTTSEASQVFNLMEILCERLSCNDTELKSLHSQVRQLKKERDDYAFRVLQFMNPSEVSDSFISDELSSIYAGISNWVECVLHELEAFDDHWPLLRQFLKRERLYPSTGNPLQGTLASLANGEILMMAIFRAMGDLIFSPILVGASFEERLFLKRLCRDMHFIDPKKDPRAMVSWRSDTFRACASSQQYASTLEEKCHSLTEYIFQILVFAGVKDDDRLTERLKRFEEQIAKPAAELATKMRCSTRNYLWKYHSAADRNNLFNFKKRMMDSYDCVDLRTHCLITKEKFGDLPDDTIIGESIVSIYPALYRETESTQISPLIRKGLVLVRTHFANVKHESPDEPAIGPNNACEKQNKNSEPDAQTGASKAFQLARTLLGSQPQG
ncbi:uncharacterized protein N7477_008624 [Penicillium maclennaniae]|uniref:uncharacterized protein n=1 Tax=Penicillium maclennaniae TaxID=1343394 RepID=UPI0025404735|nr:uncharacterized protein N7477_008624 [Penicillium maclennaniae]KAJ5666176.1 hypothetical protein N7477_008624 [Penicillium maclennaniae]